MTSKFLDDEAFENLFSSFKESAFRLQTLPTYDVEFEKADFARFKAGKPCGTDRMAASWYRTINQHVEAGRQWENIHLLPRKLTPYLRYLIDWGYVFQSSAGADIAFIFKEKAKDEWLNVRDFWLFDNQQLVWMHYDEANKYLGATFSTEHSEVVQAVKMKSEISNASFDLETLMKLRRLGHVS